MKTVSIPLAIVIISILGFFLIIVQVSEKSNLKYNAKEMHSKVISENYLLDKSKFDKLHEPKLIDIRNRETFTLKGINGALNIPLSSILQEENLRQFKGPKAKVIIAYDPISANETWMLLSQMGYESIFILDPADLN